MWNASTNTPTLANPPASTGCKSAGLKVIANVAGKRQFLNQAGKDWIISDGTAWSKVDNTDAISSVFAYRVAANAGDYAASLITNDSVPVHNVEIDPMP